MKQIRAHHYGLTVADIDVSRDFYLDTLGLEQLHRAEVGSPSFRSIVGVEDADAEIVFVDAHGIVIELFEYSPSTCRLFEGRQRNDAVGAHHIAFDVDDATAWYERLRKDVDFISEPQAGDTGAYAAYFYDPDGNVIEIIEGDSVDYL